MPIGTYIRLVGCSLSSSTVAPRDSVTLSVTLENNSQYIILFDLVAGIHNGSTYEDKSTRSGVGIDPGNQITFDLDLTAGNPGTHDVRVEVENENQMGQF